MPPGWAAARSGYRSIAGTTADRLCRFPRYLVSRKRAQMARCRQGPQPCHKGQGAVFKRPGPANKHEINFKNEGDFYFAKISRSSQFNLLF
jgi:hypothetical protein